MKKLIAITTSTVLLSLLGASGFNLNTNLKVYAASTECTTKDCSNSSKNCATINCDNSKNCSTKGRALVYKKINLSNCNNVDEVVKKLRANGFTNVTTNNIKNVKGLKNILNTIEGKAVCTNTKKASTTAPKVTTAPKATTAPTPTTAPKATTTTSNTTTSNYANQVLELVNKERAKEGLSALTTNTTLTSAANERAKETVQSFSHTRPNGTTFSTVLKDFNISYRAAGENIAYGQKTPQEVVTGWMNSPGHRANIMNANFGKVGIGVHKASNGTIYWTQVFTN